QHGASYQQILAKYFPGASVAGGPNGQTAKWEDPETLRQTPASTSLAMNGLIAAPPHHSAVRLCLTGHLSSSSLARRLRLLAGEAQPRNKNGNGPERRSLSALESGRAAKDGEQERLFADLLWDHLR